LRIPAGTWYHLCAVLFRVKYDTGGFGQWARRQAQRAPHNKVVVAIANKLARIA
jgi:transposase